MKTAYIFLLLFFCMKISAQQQSYDVFTFTPPKGWKKTAEQNSLHFSISENTKGTWSQIGMIKSTASKGSLDADFQSEWKDLVVKPYGEYGVSDQPLSQDTQTVYGWRVCTGLGKFVFNKDTAAILLNTFSDGQRCASFIIMSNTVDYGTVLDEFIASLHLSQPTANSAPTELPQQGTVTGNTASQPFSDGFQFNTTYFNDGWTSVVKEDWVEATKGNMKVLIHYPREEDSKYYSQYTERVNVFWNLLVAPRYSNLRQFQSPGYNYSFDHAYFAAGLLNDNATKKDVWVALFQKGKNEWVEVIAPDKASFVNMFKVDNPDSYFSDWDSLERLSGMNRFSVGENDLPGKWSENFYGSQSYYNTYTGLYTGSTTFTSAVSFHFNKNKTYNWHLVMANGATGSATKVDQAKASGTWKVLNNWQIWCSEIERKPRTYNAYFSCVKGGRILWLQDVEYGSYTAYKKTKE
ncbi:MAG TPA: hypothetical protein VFR58_07595 [Flavisolibacter sp.]|nr:hypothetical protein [Flavisolibacter sp.]